MRATTVLGILSRLKDQETIVRGFVIEPNGTITLDVVPRKRVGRCSICERKVHGCYDTRTRLWRHTDLGEHRVMLRYALRRLNCGTCGTPKTESVPWAEFGSWHTYDFEDLTAYSAQHMDATRTAELMRVSWRTVGNIVRRVVARKLPDDRLDGLRHIGIDELSYKRHHEYVTVVVDHDRRRVAWCAPGKSGDTVREFFEALGPQRVKKLKLVSIDMSAAYIAAVKECAPDARIVFDRFHVQKLAHDALDEVRRALVRELAPDDPARRATKRTRFVLQKRPRNLTGEDVFKLADVARHNRPLFRAYLMKEKLAMLLDNVDASAARRALHAWCNATVRSRVAPFVRAARTIRKHIDGVVAYIETGLNNGRIEGMNGKIRVLTRRAYGFHDVWNFISMITLCCSGLNLKPRHA